MTIAKTRREVHYASLHEFLSEVERLANSRICTLGNWTFPQILDHLARTMQCSFEGFGSQAPWLVRKVLAPLVKNSFLTRPMKAGFRLPKRMASALLPSSEATLPAALEKLRDIVARCEAEVPTAAHPAFGRLASQEWTSLHLRHAELHMSFVVPAGTAAQTDN